MQSNILNLIILHSICLISANLIGIDTVHHQVLSGTDMDSMSEHQLEKVINNVSIFYRVTPKHKVIIVKVSVVSMGYLGYIGI